MIDAEDRLLFACNHPHWGFDLASQTYDLPFLSEQAKHDILSGTAACLFKRSPRNATKKEKPDQARQYRGLA